MSHLEETLALEFRAHKMKPEREYRFHPERKWRFDFAFPESKVAVECEGGVWSGGRHTRGSGFEDDCEKYSTAASLGWLVLRFTERQIDSGLAIGLVRVTLDERIREHAA